MICEAAAEVDSVANVNVTEAHGMTGVIYGDPAHPAGECAKV